MSTAYIAGAMEANGSGRLTSVDREMPRDSWPSAPELLLRAGLSHRVSLVFERTSYNWFLQRMLRERTSGGVTTPLYDFVFLDGAHTWVDDGFAFFLVDRLLRPGGRILFDDLTWRMDERWPDVPEEERRLCQVREVFELLVATHPLYDELRVDSDWAWVRKSRDPQPAVRTVVKRDLVGSLREVARLVRRRARPAR